MTDKNRTPHLLLGPLLSGLVYFAAAMLAVITSRFEGGLAFIWVANAFLMADLATTRTSYWWRTILSCFIASTVATALFGMGPAAALPMAAINMIEALIVTALCRRFIPDHAISGSLRPLVIYILALALVSDVVTGFMAAGLATVLIGAPFWGHWLQWYTGHVLGALTFTPICTMVLTGELRKWLHDTGQREKIEAAVLLALFSAITFHVFFLARYPLLFVPFLPMTIIALRVGYIGSAAAVLIIAVIGGAAALTGHGPINMLSVVSVGAKTQMFQLYLAVIFLSAVPLAAEMTTRRHLFQRIRASEARYRVIAENSGDVVLNISVDGIIQYASPSVARHVGLPAEKLIGEPATALLDPADQAIVIATHLKALKQPNEAHSVEFRPKYRLSNMNWAEMLMRAVVDDRGTPVGVVGTIRDMSRRKAAEHEWQTAANVDQLTGAATRRAFLERLDREIADFVTDKPACLALIDIDHFKAVNDRYGHLAGDEVLAAFVRQLRPGIRGTDMIGRLGGEEFAILLTDANLARATVICERLRSMVGSMLVPLAKGGTVTVTFSAGLVELDRGLNGAALLEAADKALYAAKHGGRNCLRLAA